MVSVFVGTEVSKTIDMYGFLFNDILLLTKIKKPPRKVCLRSCALFVGCYSFISGSTCETITGDRVYSRDVQECLATLPFPHHFHQFISIPTMPKI